MRREFELFYLLFPRILVFLVYVTGILLLFSASIVERISHFRIFENIFPVTLIEASHFAASLTGLVLIFLAEGLRKRIDSAYALTILFLGIAAGLSLLNGFNFFEAVAFLALVFLLFSTRGHFHRKGSLLRMDYSVRWLASSILVLVSFVALGFFLYQYVDYSDELWWRLEFNAGAPRFLRVALGVFVLLLILGLSRLLSLAPPKFRKPPEEVLKKARGIIEASGRYSAWLGLSGDKSFIFSKNEKAFLMYRVNGRSWVALGDPVGPRDEWKEIIIEFRRHADLYCGWPVFFEISKEHLSLYLDLGFNLFKIGEEAKVDLKAFHIEDPPFRDLRQAIKKFSEKGFSFELLSAPPPEGTCASLKAVSDQWLRSKHAREKHFSLGSFNENYLKNFPIAVVRLHGEIFAFANIWTNAARTEFSADLMRYRPQNTPGGIMDYLFANLIVWGQTQAGFEWMNLGMAPLSGLENHEFSPLWLRLGSLVYRHGEHFYNFQDLRQYKEKFCPRWEPKYLASPGGLAVPKILADISVLISGSVRGILFR